MKLAAAKAVEMTVGAKTWGVRPHHGKSGAIFKLPPPRRLLDCFLNSNPERSFPQPSAQASFRLILRLEKTQRRSGRFPARNYKLLDEALLALHRPGDPLHGNVGEVAEELV
jgi:hypothetical protein